MRSIIKWTKEIFLLLSRAQSSNFQNNLHVPFKEFSLLLPGNLEERYSMSVASDAIPGMHTWTPKHIQIRRCVIRPKEATKVFLSPEENRRADCEKTVATKKENSFSRIHMNRAPGSIQTRYENKMVVVDRLFFLSLWHQKRNSEA